MKVAIPWSTDVKNRYGNEYNITFNELRNNFDKLFDFVSKYKDTRFNIQPDNMNYQQMEAIDNINPFIYFKIDLSYKVVEEMKKRGLKFFFNASSAPSSLSLLEEQIILGTTDIYICDDLCYNLEYVKNICEKNNVQTRLILNEIPSKRFDKGINPKAPIFIPECIEELSKYVDVGEFNVNSWVKIGTLYRIWFERQEWRENLKYIYKDLEIDIPNESLIPNFIEFKMNCGYRCARGSSCNKCEQFVEIARDLKSKNIEYKKEKI